MKIENGKLFARLTERIDFASAAAAAAIIITTTLPSLFTNTHTQVWNNEKPLCLSPFNSISFHFLVHNQTSTACNNRGGLSIFNSSSQPLNE
jgi:hypothetical protein